MGFMPRCLVVIFASLALLSGSASAALPFDAPAHAVGEVVGKRTPESRTWEMPSGEHVTQIAPGPVQWQDRQGVWHDVDLSLRDALSGWSAQAGPNAIQLPGTLDASQAAGRLRVTTEDGDTVAIALQGRPVDGKATGGVVRYASVADGVDLQLHVVPEGVKEDLVLGDRDASRSLSYQVELGSAALTLEKDASGDLVAKRTDAVVFRIPAPVLMDAKGKLEGGRFTIKQLDGRTWQVGVELPQSWLDAKDRAWPVIVDPTVLVPNTFNARIGDDCQDWYPATFPATPSCNTGDTRSAGWMALMPPAPNRWEGLGVLRWSAFTLVPSDVIDSATLKLYRTGSNSPTTPLRAYRMTAIWTDATHLPGMNMPDANMDLAPVGEFPLGGVGLMQADVSNIVSEWVRYAQTGGVQGVQNNGIALTHSDHMGSSGFGYCQSSPCDQTTYASTQNADPSKRPVLEVKSFPLAPAGSAILTPEEGQLTGRRVNLQAKALRSSVTTVRFQYIAGSQRSWADVPLAALRTTDNQAIASTDVSVQGPVGDRRSQMLVWDLSAMPGGTVDGPVHVRAWLGSPQSGDGGMTQEVNFRLDRRGISANPTVPIGPGSLDLSSGEFSMSETDTVFKGFLQDLQLERSYGSRGVTSRNIDMFGPGWEASVDPDGGDLPYKGIYNYSEVRDVVVDRDQTDPAYSWEDFDDSDSEPVQDTERWEYHYAIVELADGSKMTFTQTVDASGRATGWVPDDEHPGYALSRANTRTTDVFEFTLSEPDGGVAKFQSEIAKSPNYRITSYQQPGSSSAMSYSYQAAGTRQRLSSVTAPVVAGYTRKMLFVWGSVGTPAVSRVTSVQVQNGGDTPITVAQYDYDTQGRLIKETDPRIAGGVRNTQYHYNANGHLDQITPAGRAAWNLTYAQISGDAGWRLSTISRAHPDGGTATSTVLYNVPITGASAPYEMGPTETAKWGQDDIPWDAVAVFPQDAIPDPRSPDYRRATIHYLDADGREVNVAAPGGAISTSEFDGNGNVLRTLTPQGRAVALAAGASSASVAQDRSTLYHYTADGVDQDVVREPVTNIQLSDGTTVRGRRMSITHYDEGSPGGTFHLPTSEWTAVERASDGAQLDAREKVDYFYDANGGGDGWAARHATKIVVDPAGRAETSYSILHPDYPIVEETRTPGGAAGGNTPDVQYYQYYAIMPSSRVPTAIQNGWCPLSNAGHMPGMLCERSEGTSPTALIPRRLHTYDAYGNLTSTDETKTTVLTAGTDHRRTTFGYDAAEQLASKSVTDGTGTATPDVANGYAANTGDRTSSASTAGTITRTYDSNGRLASYTDAAGTVTTYRYDLRGRKISQTVAGATTTFGYDDRDNLTSVTDPAVGTAITASYDLNDNLASETLPNALVMTELYDETDQPTQMTWTKTSGCSSNCTWGLSQILSRDVNGRITAQRTANTNETLVYDTVGRLVRDDAVKLSNNSCVRKTYTYDAGGAGDSNRTSSTTWTSSAGGACGTGTSSTRTLSYDDADRITSTGWIWDTFGRATGVPAADSGGTGALTNTYYTNDRVRQLTLDGRIQLYTRDALDRTKTVASSGAGKPSFTETYRYGDDSDTPVKTTVSTGSVLHDVEGPSGQIVASKVDSVLTYDLRDLQGSIIATAPASGTPTRASEYDPFGTVTTPTPNVIDWTYGDPGEGWLGAYQRATDFGQETAGAAGPVEMGARVYLPKVGRFLQTDPIDGGSLNAYDYGNQDPMNARDLSGEGFSIGGVIQVVAGGLSIAVGVTTEVVCSAGTISVGDVLGPIHCYSAAGIPIAAGGILFSNGLNDLLKGHKKFRVKLRVVRRINRLQCSVGDYINVTARAAPKPS